MQNPQPDSRAIGLIGGIGLTEVRVYAQRAAPDGKFSGCPHVHAVTDEGYFVLQGTGSVEFHDPVHGLRTLGLEAGHYVHFPPLVMHRLISDGDLIILGMMGNAGLAERGEADLLWSAGRYGSGSIRGIGEFAEALGFGGRLAAARCGSRGLPASDAAVGA